ncbi:hypothetical protein HDE_14409 [Halotydeus destructor]|nr:hypothetical protein HDE_14409 [Halotydeus destructor]
MSTSQNVSKAPKRAKTWNSFLELDMEKGEPNTLRFQFIEVGQSGYAMVIVHQVADGCEQDGARLRRWDVHQLKQKLYETAMEENAYALIINEPGRRIEFTFKNKALRFCVQTNNETRCFVVVEEKIKLFLATLCSVAAILRIKAEGMDSARLSAEVLPQVILKIIRENLPEVEMPDCQIKGKTYKGNYVKAATLMLEDTCKVEAAYQAIVLTFGGVPEEATRKKITACTWGQGYEKFTLNEPERFFNKHLIKRLITNFYD